MFGVVVRVEPQIVQILYEGMRLLAFWVVDVRIHPGFSAAAPRSPPSRRHNAGSCETTRHHASDPRSLRRATSRYGLGVFFFQVASAKT